MLFLMSLTNGLFSTKTLFSIHKNVQRNSPRGKFGPFALVLQLLFPVFGFKNSRDFSQTIGSKIDCEILADVLPPLTLGELVLIGSLHCLRPFCVRFTPVLRPLSC